MTLTADYVTDDDVAISFDHLLGGVGRIANPRILPGIEVLTWAGALARRPRTPAARALELAGEIGRVVAGVSEAAPSKRDRRFVDPAWSGNPLLRRWVQTYLVAIEKAQQLIEDVDLDERTQDRLRLLVENLSDALAPSNTPLLNPASAKETIDTGGASLLRGVRNFVTDMSSRPRVPSMVDNSSFELGENLAATPGDVLLRTPMFELIRYAPSTKKVHSVPLLMVPPTINKYYVLDLSPGRSMIEYLVSQGHQVFVMSWRNPSARHADWGLDAYIHAVEEALDAVREITASPTASVYAACSGGIIASMAAAHLAATGRGDELSSLTLAVTVLDQRNSGTVNSVVDRRRAEAAAAMSRRAGYLDGNALAEVFAWLRPNDLIWNYWVNNYLLGKVPPAFDILSWNADTTRMPARLHAEFLALSIGNKLASPGDASALGVPVDLGRITADSYIIGGETDHLTPWQACYRSTGLLGGKSEFVLSTSGHIAALVNPPTNVKASFRHATDPSGSPQQFVEDAEQHQGSWWTHYADWLGARSGELRAATVDPGRGRFQSLGAAPGTYVFDK